MNREKHFHPLAALHLLRKTLLVYLLPLVQVLFDRNWDALRAALRQELVLLFFISAVCWAVYYGGRWQVDAGWCCTLWGRPRPSLCILPGSRPRSLPMCCCR